LYKKWNNILELFTLYDSLANRAWRSIYLKENRECK